MIQKNLQGKTDLNSKMSENLFRTLIEKSSDAIQLVSAEGNILYTSGSIKNVLGYTPEELEGLGIAPFLHPEDIDYFMKNFQEFIKDPGGQIVLNYRVKHKDGSWAWLETIGVNHLQTPNINALVGNFRNITDRKNAEEKLKENEARLKLALEAGEIGVWDWDVVSNKIKWTDKVYEIHEVEKNSFDGEFVNYVSRVHPEDKERFEEAVQSALQDKTHYNIEFRIITAKGRTKWVSTSATVFYENDKPVRMLGATKDITKRKELERQKDEFLAIASHELKTPVTSLKAYGQVLQMVFEQKGDSSSVASLQKMDSQINKLTSLISALLDTTKIQSGKLIMHEEEYDFNELLNEIIDELQLTTSQHTIIKNLDTSKKVYGDKERIGQVLTNLITNAIKYSPGSDKIIIKTEAGNESILFCVQDFGVGISKDKQARVFEQFFRVSGENENTFPGLGLGLYISSEIIKRQNGKIWVTSSEGNGSEFCFTIPLKQPHN
ncbi:MAG TPA: PAS domain-containing protein [Chitinophagaceae bacterium]|nr:PAS domain-containing protein [Chitinophagaceae bacterium]